MSRTTVKTMNAPVKVRPSSHRAIKKIARRNRMDIVDAVEVLVRGWELLTDEQKRAAIELEDAPEPATA